MMKVSFSLRGSSISSIFQPIFFLHSSSGVRVRPISTCSTTVSCPSSTQNHITPKTPLFLRPPTFRATLSDLKKWHLWAKSLATSVGNTFLDLDNGPDATLLQRELSWLIQDALEHPKTLESGNDRDYTSCNDADVTVSLRACLDDLYALWKQRIDERRPFQYVVGCEHWRDLVLSVEEGVLIPRPETELIVDLVDEVVKKNAELREGLWADLGTGSGALAIGIAKILDDYSSSNGKVIATDLSPVAVAVATYNVQRYNLQDRISIRQGSWFEPLKDSKGELAGLVSNPPYIPSENISGLQAEVAKYEPRLALDGGATGLDDLLHLCNGAATVLRPGGFFAFETNGEKQSILLADFLESGSQGSFCNVKIVSDFAGIQRFVTGIRER